MSRAPSFSRGRARALLAASVAFAIAVPGLAALEGRGSAFAVEEEAESAPPPLLVVAPAEPILASDAEELRFEVLLRNPDVDALEAGEIVLSIDSEQAEQAADLELGRERAALEFARAAIAETPAAGEQLIEISVRRDEVPLWYARQPGVYAVDAEYVSASEAARREAERSPGAAEVDGAADDADDAADTSAVEATTALIWERVDAAPVQLTLVVPLLLPGTIATLPTSSQLATLAPGLIALLDAAEERNATLAVDPRIIAGVRALGTSAPAQAATLLDRLERTQLPLFLLQYADADPAAQAALGFESLMQPLGLSYAVLPGAVQIEVGNADGAGSLGPEQAEASRGVAMAEVAALTQLPNATPGAWPAGGEVDSATLALLAGADLTSLVLDSGNVTNASGTRVQIGGFEALVSDAGIGEAARASLAGDSPAERAAGIAALASRLAIAARSGSPGIVLALDRGAVADSTDPRTIFATLDGFDWVQTVSERLQPAGTAELRAGATREERRELLRATVLRSQQIDELAPLLTRPEQLLEYQRERLLEAFAARHASPDIDFTEVDALMQQRDDELLQGVQPITSEHTQLVGATSRVPITLSNSLPFEASVVLRAAPTSAAISITEREIAATVPAVGNSIVLVPVHSRVSSGESGIALEVRDGAGERGYSTGLQHLVLRTTVETIMLWALGGAALLLLGFGTWRSIRRKRGGEASGEPSAAEAMGAELPEAAE